MSDDGGGASPKIPFGPIPVGGRPVPRPKTGITQLDVEVTILHRCLDRLQAKRLQSIALPPPYTGHSALSPVVTPILPPVNEARELVNPDLALRYNADGTLKSPASPGFEGRTDGEPNGVTPGSPMYRTSIGLDELELEVSIMRTSLDNLVMMVAKMNAAAGEARPKSAPDSVPPSVYSPPGSPANSMPPPGRTPQSRQTVPGRALSLCMDDDMPGSPSALSPSVTSEHSSRLPKLPSNVVQTADNSFWGHISRYCVYGMGTYQFNVGDVGNRLKLAKEAINYGLGSLTDELFAFPKCSIISREIRYFVRSNERPDDSRLSVVKSTLVDAQGEEHLAVRDCPGILYFLGTCYNTQVWRNPTQLLDRKLLDVKASSTFGPGKAADVATAYVGYFITQDHPSSWIQLDFCNQLVIPKCYSFSSAHPMYAGYYPRSWEFQGSMDGKTWVCLKRHINDTTINKFNPVGYWLLEGRLGREKTANRTCYRYFRILQTGPNSFGTNELQCSSFEVYGQLIYINRESPLPAPAPAWDPGHVRDPPPPPPMPDLPKPAAAKGKAKKK